MKHFSSLAFAALLLAGLQQGAAAQTTLRIFDTVLFYDGYAAAVSNPVPQPGVIRHRNDLYARKLSAAELSAIGNKLSMQVTVNAACDNYDRIGNVNLALVPKGATTYKPDSVRRIEIARYITPFMNKNVPPNTVPYNYNIDNVANLLHEASITSVYDIWVELQLFGVPYAANTQISGCTGRNDVFYGSLDFITSGPATTETTNVLLPLNFQKNLNNYDTAATDTVGKTSRTISFSLTTALSDAALFLITSNHGSNTDGEEYNRRDHFVYFDNRLVLNYKPGAPSCEPYRQYNTQGNGIYGRSPRTDDEWQSFSNWCPGDTIPIRRINLGALAAGAHKFFLTVPDAVFAAGQGYFPVSVYLQGKTTGRLNAGGAGLSYAAGVAVYPNPTRGAVTVDSRPDAPATAIEVQNAVGATVLRVARLQGTRQVLDLSTLPAGLYVMHISTATGVVNEKVIVEGK